MPTGSNKIAITQNRLLSREDLADNFLGYMEESVDETVAAMLQGNSGVFESAEIALQEGATGADYFEFYNLGTSGSPAPKKVATANGKVVTLNPELAQETDEISFENALGANYEVGIRWNERDDQVQLNPSRGYPEYRSKLQVFGEVGAPDSVTDGSTYIRLWIDGLTDPLGSHTFAGRKAIAWLATPVSGDQATAFYEGTIAYDGVNGNYLQIPYSGGNGPLGQDTSASAPSTTASDYRVHVKGPSVRKGTNTVIKTDKENYAFIGSITGAGTGVSATYSMVGQKKVFLVTLDNAYDGGGSGAGNEIDVDVAQKPVTFNSFQASSDIRPDQKKVIEVRDPRDKIQICYEQYGRIATTPRFSDEFVFLESKWTGAASSPDAYVANESTAGARVRSLPSAHSVFPKMFGACQVLSESNASSRSYIQGGRFDVYQQRPYMYFRLSFKGMETDYGMRIGIANTWSTLAGPFLGFRIIDTDLIGEYKPNIGGVTNTAVLATPVADTVYDCYIVCTSNTLAQFWVTGMTTPVTMTLGDNLDDAGVNWLVALGCESENAVGTSNDHEVIIDHWEVGLVDRIRSA